MTFVSRFGALLIGLSITLLAHAEATPEAALDTLYQAGADANYAAFESLLAQDVVFLGVGGAGRLEGQAARAYFSELMAQGGAWAYSSSLRQTRVSADGSVAWFDETLEVEQLGLGRATGVLVRSGEGWRIAQYNLSLPVSGGAAGAQPADVQEKKRCRVTSHKTNTRAKC